MSCGVVVSDVYLLQETRFVVLRGMYFFTGDPRCCVVCDVSFTGDPRCRIALDVFLQEIRFVVLLAMYFFTGDP